MGKLSHYFVRMAVPFIMFLGTLTTSLSDSMGPDIHIPFDESGDAILKGGKPVKGIIYGKSIFDNGAIGHALTIKRHAYDQVTCYNLKDLPPINLTEGTVSFWFKPNWDGFNNKKYEIFRIRSDWHFQVYLLKNDKGGLDYSVRSPKQLQVYKKCSFKAGQWQHITMTWNIKNKNSALYLNGKLLGSGNAKKDNLIVPLKWTGLDIWLGESSSNNYNAKVGEGLYDDLKIFSRSLSKSEIHELTLTSRKDAEAKDLDIRDAKPISSMPELERNNINASNLTLFKGCNNEIYFDKNSNVNSLSFWFKLKKETYPSPVRFLETETSNCKISFNITGMNGFISVNLKSKNKAFLLKSNYLLKLNEIHHVLINLTSGGEAALYLDGALQCKEIASHSSFGKIEKIKIGGQVLEVFDLLALKKTFPVSELSALLKKEKKLYGIERLTIKNPSKFELELWSLKEAAKKIEGARERICLDGIWRVIPTNNYSIYPPLGEWGLIRVPGSFRSPLFDIYKEKKGKMISLKWKWNKLPLVEYRAAWYQRIFKIPKSIEEQNIFINFKNIIGDYGRIYINDTLVDSFTNDSPSYTAIPNPMRVNVTKYIKAKGNNSLTVFIDRKYSKLWRGTPSIYDHLEIALDDVWLESGQSNVQVANVLAFPSYRNKDILIKTSILNPEKLKTEAKLMLKFNYKGRVEKEFTQDIALTGVAAETIKFKMPWRFPRLWDCENPNLYKLTAILYGPSNKVLDSARPLDFGFREFWVQDGKFFMNGKETRLRMWTAPSFRRLLSYYGTPKGIKQYIAKVKQIGYNSIRCHYIQGLSTQVGWKQKFSEADKQGLYLLQPAPPYEGIVSPPKYGKYIGKYIEAFGNHPSIIMWYTDFNTCGYPWSQDPTKLNDTEYAPKEKEGARKLAHTAGKIIEQHDPSRETFQHAGGNSGKIFGSMNYQSLGVPLQEREDWPKQWSERHTQPLMVVETGFPVKGQFLHFDKHKGVGNKKAEYTYLFAEHAARYFGDKAFKKALLPGETTTDGHVKVRGGYFRNYPENFTDVKRLFINNIVKAWRAYGVSALGHFPFISDHGDMCRVFDKMDVVYEVRDDLKGPGLKPDRTGSGAQVHKHRISDYTKTLPLFYKYQKVFSPLLVFLGGKTDDFTNKDHAFYSGEEFEKSIVAVNDKATEQKLEFKWKLIDKSDNKILAEDDFFKAIDSGQIAKYPITFKAPEVYERTDAVLKLTVINGGRLFCKDSLDLQFFPKHFPVKFKDTSVALYDPVGQTAKMLKDAGLPFLKVNKFQDLKGRRLLIIGKNALGKTPLEFLKKLDTSRMIENGLKILVFEQKECNLGNLVFERSSQRIALIRKNNHPVIRGLKKEDFKNWRGGTDTVPEIVLSDEHSPHYPKSKWKCGNNGIIAGRVIRKPQYGNFTPILDCGFNLMNTPLLELCKGRGVIVFCQLDLTHRYLKDPVATALADNLLKYMTSPFVPLKGIRTAYIGGDRSKKLIERMGAETTRVSKVRSAHQLKNFHVIILGEGAGKILDDKKDFIVQFLEYGGGIFVMPGVKDFSYLPFKAKKVEQKLFKATLPRKSGPVFDNIPNADLYFRDIMEIPVTKDLPCWTVSTNPAIISKVDYGKGAVVFFNIVPEKIKGLWNNEKTSRLMAKILSNMYVNLGKDYKLFSNDKYRHNQIGNPHVSPEKWEFRTDPQNIGDKERWYKDIYKMPEFKPIKVSSSWESQGITQKNPYYKYPAKAPRRYIQPYDGYAWYRTKFFLPKEWKGHKIFFKSGKIDDNDCTYINGKLIGKTTFADTPKAYAIPRNYEIPVKHLEFGEENTIAIRVFDKWGRGGILGDVTIEPEKNIEKDSWSPYIDDLDFYDPDAFHNW